MALVLQIRLLHILVRGNKHLLELAYVPFLQFQVYLREQKVFCGFFGKLGGRLGGLGGAARLVLLLLVATAVAQHLL